MWKIHSKVAESYKTHKNTDRVFTESLLQQFLKQTAKEPSAFKLAKTGCENFNLIHLGF